MRVCVCAVVITAVVVIGVAADVHTAVAGLAIRTCYLQRELPAVFFLFENTCVQDVLLVLLPCMQRWRPKLLNTFLRCVDNSIA